MDLTVTSLTNRVLAGAGGVPTGVPSSLGVTAPLSVRYLDRSSRPMGSLTVWPRMRRTAAAVACVKGARLYGATASNAAIKQHLFAARPGSPPSCSPSA